MATKVRASGVSARKTASVRSPYDGTVVGEVALADGGAAAQALERAREIRRRLPTAHERAAMLRRAAEAIEARHAALAHQIAKEGGKPLIDARVETTRAANTLRLCAEEATRIHGDEIPMTGSAAAAGRYAFTTYEPIGVVLAISAFNHPLNLIAHQVGPAIAAGCPVLVVPALETPLSCLALVEALRAAGLPEAAAQVLVCDNDTTGQLAARDDLAFVSFIGSAKVGWQLRNRLAPGVRCGLEHGGIAPVVVDAGVDLARVVPPLVKGAMYHAGQVCVSVQRVFAHRSLVEDLATRLAAACQKLVVGDPTLSTTEVGPLIRAREVERVHAWVEEARQAGARVACGGKPLGNQCYAPTVLVEPPATSRVMCEEVFGPVVCVSAFDALDEAIELANRGPWSFQAAIMTPSVDRALHAVRHLKAATVLVNDHTAFRVDWMPFGGHEQSGLGLGGVAYGVRELLSHKLVVLNAD